MTPEQDALIIHYPSGGFGHFLSGLLAICADDVFANQDQDIIFSKNGSAHAVSLSVKKWVGYRPGFRFEVNDWAQGSTKRHILLIDSLISNDSQEPFKTLFPNNQVIRVCIDYDAIPIIYQTCKYKSQPQHLGEAHAPDPVQEPWEKRESLSLMFHHCDQNPNDFYLRNFKPIIDFNTFNLPISWLFYNFQELMENISNFLNIEINYPRAAILHEKFLKTNSHYAMGPIWANRVLDAIKTNNTMDLSDCTSIYDQGYINYRVEKEYNLAEIPAYTYRNWFKDTGEIRQLLRLTR